MRETSGSSKQTQPHECRFTGIMIGRRPLVWKATLAYVEDTSKDGDGETEAHTISPERRKVLLTEYKETIKTLRSWDRVVFQILTAVTGLATVIVTYAAQQSLPIPWIAVSTLVFFWVGFYLFTVKTAQLRICVLLEIEKELQMVGQYGAVQRLKSAKHVLVSLVVFLIPALLGPLIGYLIARFTGS